MNRRAFTMIEMLVALAATLMMMAATVTLFGVIVDSVSGSRALLEISDKLRATRNRMQADLQGATATMKPPLRPENDEGYLEIVEGTNFDGASNIPSTGPPFNTLFGDTDDALLLTVRSRGEPFVGKFNAATAESQVAEVLYFVKQDGPIIDATTSPPLKLFTLYRRAFIVLPGAASLLPAPSATFYDFFDISARFDNTGGTPLMIPNTLGDLTKRENRFSHFNNSGGSPIYPPVLPFGMSDILPGAGLPANFPTSNGSVAPLTGTRLGDDILMTNVLSFDVQVYDPGAPVFISTSTPPVAVEPRDQGYASVRGGTAIAAGAYADLGYLFNPPVYSRPPGFPVPQFDGAPDPKSGIPATRTPTNPYVYDTWSLHYENDGVDQFSDGTIDLATNGLDDAPSNGVVDDITERETMAPYPSPLRGVRITIRVYEPSSLQVRQVTIVQDFLPE